MLSNEQRAHDLATLVISNIISDSSKKSDDPIEFLSKAYLKYYNSFLDMLNKNL